MFKLLLAIICALCVFTACTTGKQFIGDVLETAYEAGGAEKVSAEIDKLVEEGRLTPKQAEILKQALQKSYERMREKLKDVE